MVSPLKPEDCANRHCRSRHCHQQNQWPLCYGSRYFLGRRRRRYGGCLWENPISVFLPRSKIPAACPGIQLLSKRVDRTHPVVEVPVDGHPLPLFPALNRRHVSIEVSRDFLPRVQPVFRRSFGRRSSWQWVAHRAPDLARFVVVRERDCNSIGKSTAMYGIPRQIAGIAPILCIAV